jgi:adenylosuccinate lyase
LTPASIKVSTNTAATFAQAVMMGLAPCLGREYAHDLVHDICRGAIQQKRHLFDLLAENEEITKQSRVSK